MSHPDRHYPFITDEDFANGEPHEWIAVLPLGATEQHGEHLPPHARGILAADRPEHIAKLMADLLTNLNNPAAPKTGPLK